MKQRNLRHAIEVALADTPVVLVNGARQTGKTTMVRDIARKRKATFVTLDDHAVLDIALNDPPGFIAGLGRFAVIDEVQNAPNIFRAIKASVDRDRKPGRFLLTGSANVLVLPKMADSLAGRMEIVTLHPMAMDELLGRRSTFLDKIFQNRLVKPSGTMPLDRKKLATMVLAGGYPEVMGRKEAARRAAWYKSYVTTILQRDVRDISNISGLTDLPKLLNALAERSSGLLNLADLSRTLHIPHTTIRRYMALLEATFLSTPLPAWQSHRISRLMKTPKIHLEDSGFAGYLCGIESVARMEKSNRFGHLLETFVVNELRKVSGWSKVDVTLHHYRTEKGREVDVVLEDNRGRVVGIEVKAASAVNYSDLAGLRDLKETAGDKWLRGIVLHTGPGMTDIGKDMHTLPLQSVWSW